MKKKKEIKEKIIWLLLGSHSESSLLKKWFHSSLILSKFSYLYVSSDLQQKGKRHTLSVLSFAKFRQFIQQKSILLKLSKILIAFLQLPQLSLV